MRKPILKRALWTIAIVILGLLLVLGYTFKGKALDISSYESMPPQFEPGKDVTSEPVEVTLSLIKCGKMTSKEIFVYRGGNAFKKYESGMAAILVKHPKGTLLFDTGFGANVDEHVKSIPLLMRALATYEKEVPAAVQLKEHGIDTDDIRAIILSHSHWDHVSGLDGFPGAKVWIAGDELEYIRNLGPGELINKLKESVKLNAIEFMAKRYENFPRSLDVFVDGSIVLVPLPGHTPGSMGMFVNLRSGKRFFFIGDLTWCREGIQLPAERPWISRRLVDKDDEQVRRAIVRVHNLAKRYPDMIIVPAHDRRVHEQIASFPEVER